MVHKHLLPLTFQALSGNPVHTELLDPEAEAGMGHIELARWADLVLVAPASCDTLAKFANGLADDLLSTLYLATKAPVWVAPAMNQQNGGKSHPYLQTLVEDGVHVIMPDAGEQACGDVGLGRMPEPEEIAQVAAYFHKAQRAIAENLVYWRASVSRLQRVQRVKQLTLSVIFQITVLGKWVLLLAAACCQQGAK
jgi:phosphopantothenoylcysteine decarboxylase/phosphopantothenate--cysteine ligase